MDEIGSSFSFYIKIYVLITAKTKKKKRRKTNKQKSATEPSLESYACGMLSQVLICTLLMILQ